jgi:hypothetical protein
MDACGRRCDRQDSASDRAAFAEQQEIDTARRRAGLQDRFDSSVDRLGAKVDRTDAQQDRHAAEDDRRLATEPERP